MLEKFLLSAALIGNPAVDQQRAPDFLEETAPRIPITIVTTAEGINRKLEALMPSLEKCKKRGVKVRIAAPIDSNNIKVARDLKKVAEVKSFDKIKARFVVIDSNQLMFMLLDDEKFHPNYDIGVCINTEFFAQALEQMFELAWKEMKAVK